MIQQTFRVLASLVLIVILFGYLSFTLFRFAHAPPVDQPVRAVRRAAPDDGQRAGGADPQPGVSGRAVRRDAADPAAFAGDLRCRRPRRPGVPGVRGRLGPSDVQDRSLRARRLRHCRGVSLPARIAVRRIQRRVPVRRRAVLTWIDLGHLESHRRLRVDLSPRLQGGRHGEDRRRDRGSHGVPDPGDAAQVTQERGGRVSEFPDPRDPDYQLQRARPRRGAHPPHRSRHRLRDTVAAGRGDAARSRRTHARHPSHDCAISAAAGAGQLRRHL